MLEEPNKLEEQNLLEKTEGDRVNTGDGVKETQGNDIGIGIGNQQNFTSSVETQQKSGWPRVSYCNASKRRMRASATSVVNHMVGKCNKISQGDGWELLDDIIRKTPLKQQSKEAPNLTKILDDLTKSYGKENHGSSGRIRLLSTVAIHFSNKELKKAFPCSDYEITEARRHAKFIGVSVTPPKRTRVIRYKIPVEILHSWSTFSSPR